MARDLGGRVGTHIAKRYHHTSTGYDSEAFSHFRSVVHTALA